jgi:hypothetical protein
MVIKYIYQHFLFQGPPKFTQIWILGMKINHLATLQRTREQYRFLGRQRRNFKPSLCFGIPTLYLGAKRAKILKKTCFGLAQFRTSIVKCSM